MAVVAGGGAAPTAARTGRSRPPAHPSTAATGRPTAPSAAAARPVAPPPTAVLLRVAPQDQFPGLPNGCEVTSLSMLLGAVGHPVSRFVLARRLPLDPTPRRLGANGQVLSWGNPNVGFVGSVYVHADGFGIYHGPLTRLLDRVLPGRGLDLSGAPFSELLARVARGQPVEVWTTLTFSPNVPWVTWQSPEGPVRTTLDEHAVLLVGYGPGEVFVNNPWNGEAAQAVAEAPFVAAWRALGRQALTVAGGRVAARDVCVGHLAACLPAAGAAGTTTSPPPTRAGA